MLGFNQDVSGGARLMLARSTAQVHCQAGISGSCCLALCLAILLEAILGSVLMLRGDKDLAQMFPRHARPSPTAVPCSRCGSPHISD